MSKTLASFGLPAMIQVGGKDIATNSWTEVAAVDQEQAQQLLALGHQELIIDGCHIFGAEDVTLALGLLKVEEEHCRGHYEGCSILPLHWGFNFLSQTASLLIKSTRPEERILPQAGGLTKAKGTDFVCPGDELKGVVVIYRVMRDGLVVEANCFRNGDADSLMSATLLMATDLTLPNKPQNSSWEEIIEKQRGDAV